MSDGPTNGSGLVKQVSGAVRASEVGRDWAPLGALVTVIVLSTGLFFAGWSRLAGMLLLAGLLVGLPLLVYRDARRQGARHPLGWAVFTLMAPLVGALVYGLVRPDDVVYVTCGACDRSVDPAFAACPYCGTAQGHAAPACERCATLVQTDWRFCPTCRHALDETSLA